MRNAYVPPITIIKKEMVFENSAAVPRKRSRAKAQRILVIAAARYESQVLSYSHVWYRLFASTGCALLSLVKHGGHVGNNWSALSFSLCFFDGHRDASAVPTTMAFITSPHRPALSHPSRRYFKWIQVNFFAGRGRSIPGRPSFRLNDIIETRMNSRSRLRDDKSDSLWNYKYIERYSMQQLSDLLFFKFLFFFPWHTISLKPSDKKK